MPTKFETWRAARHDQKDILLGHMFIGMDYIVNLKILQFRWVCGSGFAQVKHQATCFFVLCSAVGVWILFVPGRNSNKGLHFQCFCPTRKGERLTTDQFSGEGGYRYFRFTKWNWVCSKQWNKKPASETQTSHLHDHVLVLHDLWYDYCSSARFWKISACQYTFKCSP